MIQGIYIPENAYEYLVAQRGALDDMKQDRMKWEELYTEMLFAELEMMRPYLPTHCESILDVGGGLGGIDALLYAHYGRDLRVTIVDGVSDSSQVELHRKTFNHSGVSRSFLKANGVNGDHVSYIDANDPKRKVAMKYDLVISLKSWCFHIAPEEHLALVLDACRKDWTVCIVDVRRGKDAWSAQLAQHFDMHVIKAGPKALCTAMYLK